MSTTPQAAPTGAGHEHKDADPVSLATIAAILALCLALILLTVWLMLHALNARRPAANEPKREIASEQELFPEPRLEANSSNQFPKWRAQETMELTGYGWIDREHGVVRIPIDQAMRLLVERGLPNVGGGETPLHLMQKRASETEQTIPERHQ
ncbi:MAG: hypothetical protein JWO45_2209 [Spartobacteria bacterium]|nr:hypothetical protein [Spartobacteria bacterium]